MAEPSFSSSARPTPPLPNDICASEAQHKPPAPIYRLPNEILALIINFYADVCSYYTHGALYDLSWTKILLVSRWWYQVGRTQRRLWSYIHVMRPLGDVQSLVRRIDAQLENAGFSRFTVSFSLHSSGGENALCEWLLEHYAAEFVSLDVSGSPENVNAILKTLYSSPLGGLRRLKFGHYEGPDGLALPDEFLRDALPCLKELTLYRVPLAWNLLHDLERISLHGCANSASSETPPNIDDILRLMQASPGLRALELHPGEAATFYSEASMYATHPTVSLPFLEYLHIKDIVYPITLLLNHLTIPATAILQLFPYQISVGLDIRPILIPLVRYIRNPSRRNKFRGLVLGTGRSRTGANFGCTMELVETPSSPGYLGLSSHRPIFDFGHPLDEAALTLNSHPRNERALRQILTKFINAARPEVITHLDARHARSLGVPTWRAVFRLLPALESVGMEVMDGGLEPENVLDQREPLVGSVVHLLEALTSGNSDSSVRLLRLSIRRWFIVTRYHSERLPTDQEAVWLGPVVAALEAFVRQRRSDFASDPTRSCDIVIVDERGYLEAAVHSAAMERMTGWMDGMGILELKRPDQKND
ncbi:hypothetical protein HMN09_00480200 [Mycena chlorophos]|uniref:F-box domain-containing protein n=1 Tax=Mycena chlorophos TaxID=658473 RepID=A0A8H6TEN2_MYCCL|nr:hypothetical protein HMN09_00480200 [Mycena chlorophos]